MTREKEIEDLNYITRQLEYYLDRWFGPEYYACSVIQDEMDDVPDAEIVNVKYGQWIKHWCDNNMIGHEYEECSVCGCSMMDTNQFWDSKFCPNCGTKMCKEN